MNKTLTDKFFGGIGNFIENIKRNVSLFSEKYDLASAPSFFIFSMVVTAGMTVNYYYLYPKVGSTVASAISLLFEVGILAWKLQGHRVKNSASQKQIVGWATWLSAIAAFAMLVSSLTERFQWGWVVAIAAIIHIVFYLLFDQNDDIRENRRANRMALENISQKNINADNAIKEAEADLKVIDKITHELTRLRNQYKHLPNDELEFVLETYRVRLLKEYKASDSVEQKTKHEADLNKDGKIGGLVQSFASDTESPKPLNPPRAGNDS
jgi:hypothetical protein